MEDNVEVYFCDLCNTSVPEVDLGAGEAVRHSGKIIGSCCLKTIRTVERPGAAAAAAGGTGRSLAALGVALLAAVAAVAVFLDWRFATETNSLRDDMAESQRAALGDVIDRLGVIEEQQSAQSGLGSAVGDARGDVATLGKRVGERFVAIEQVGVSLGAKIDGIDAAIRRLSELGGAQQAAVQRVERELQAIGREVGDLKARPDSTVRVEAPAFSGAGGADAEAPALADASPAPADAAPASTARGSDPAVLPAKLGHEVSKLEDKDPGTRFEAVDNLIRSNNPLVAPHLAGVAKDPDPFVRRLAIEGLGGFRSVLSVETCLTALADRDLLVRHGAYASLKKLTSQTLPFDPDGKPEDRRSAQRKWQRWWAGQRDSFPG